MSAAETIQDVATALGVWLEESTSTDAAHFCVSRHLLHDQGKTGWSVTAWGETTELRALNRKVAHYECDDAETLIALCLLALPADRETCPVCKGSRVQEREVVTGRDDVDLRTLGPQGWEHVAGTFATDPGEPTSSIWRRPCPTCKGPAVEESAEWPDDQAGEQACHAWCTERECAGASVEVRLIAPAGPRAWRSDPTTGSRRAIATRPGEPRGYVEVHRWARHFLGTMPVVARLGPDLPVVLDPGSPVDRDALTVFADRLQTGNGPDPMTESDAVILGEALALWITWAPCLSCGGNGERGPFGKRLHEYTDVCECSGTGLALGARVHDLEGLARRLAAQETRS